jgi:hypothetical protein
VKEKTFRSVALGLGVANSIGDMTGTVEETAWRKQPE